MLHGCSVQHPHVSGWVHQVIKDIERDNVSGVSCMGPCPLPSRTTSQWLTLSQTTLPLPAWGTDRGRDKE